MASISLRHIAPFLAVVAIPLETTLAELKVLPPTEKNLVGEWLGHDECGVEFLRISFQTNQTGCLAFAFAKTPPKVVRINSWQVRDYEIVCALKAEDQDSQPILIRLRWEGCNLRCNLTWGKAKRTYGLLKESAVFEQVGRMKKAIDAAKSDDKLDGIVPRR